MGHNNLWLPGTAFTPGRSLYIAIANLNTQQRADYLVAATSGDYATELTNGIPQYGECGWLGIDDWLIG